MQTYKIYSRVELAKKLQEILENEAQIIDLDELIENMMFYIGDQDPMLRDRLIYRTFYKLIVEDKVIDEERCRRMLHQLLSDHYLFYQIQKSNGYQTVTRSFSILVIALILHRNRQLSFLTKEEFQMTKNECIRYFKEEKDVRGYDEKLGWIHAIAHCSDALEEVLLNQDINKNDCLAILTIAANVFTNSTMIFSHEEDERFLPVIEVMLNRNFISKQEIIEWSKQLEISENYLDYKSFVQRINGKNLLRSMKIKEII